MDDYLLSAITGKRVPAIGKYSELMNQLASEPDFRKIFKPDVTYDAQVLEQQGRRAKLNINGWVLNAESLVDEKLAPQIQLRFVPGEGQSLSFKLIKNGATPVATSYAVDIKLPEMGKQVAEFMPRASQEQIKAFLKTLPHLEGDLFQNMAAFNYLYHLDEKQVSDKTSLLSKNLTIDLESFTRNLQDIARQLPAEAASASLPDLKELLSHLGSILEKMEKKTLTAPHMQTFVDNESAQFRNTLAQLTEKLSSLQGSALEGESVKTPGTGQPAPAGISPAASDAASTKQDAPRAAASSPSDVEGQKVSHSGHEPHDIVMRKDRTGDTLSIHRGEAAVSGKNALESAGASAGRGAGKLEELRDFVSTHLNPQKMVENTFKQDDNSWQTAFAWSASLPSSFLRDFRVEERAHRPDKDDSREYQVTLEFNFKKAGRMKTVLFWMDNVLSCRMICHDPASYVLMQSSKEQLRERLGESGISMNFLKIEQAGG